MCCVCVHKMRKLKTLSNGGLNQSVHAPEVVFQNLYICSKSDFIHERLVNNRLRFDTLICNHRSNNHKIKMHQIQTDSWPIYIIIYHSSTNKFQLHRWFYDFSFTSFRFLWNYCKTFLFRCYGRQVIDMLEKHGV